MSAQEWWIDAGRKVKRKDGFAEGFVGSPPGIVSMDAAGDSLFVVCLSTGGEYWMSINDWEPVDSFAGKWDGTGLPPVGTVCELRLPPGGWGRATITHQGKGLTAWLWDHVNPDQVEYAECPDRLEFRPIRTPEQIAAEQRLNAVAEMMRHVRYATPDDCESLYLAGYRKPKDL